MWRPFPPAGNFRKTWDMVMLVVIVSSSVIMPCGPSDPSRVVVSCMCCGANTRRLGFGSFSWRLVFMPDDEPSFDGIENFMSGRAPARSLCSAAASGQTLTLSCARRTPARSRSPFRPQHSSKLMSVCLTRAAVFWVDLPCNFVTGVYNQGQLISAPRKIALNYLKGSPHPSPPPPLADFEFVCATEQVGFSSTSFLSFPLPFSKSWC
jgi:hypothetical protein